MYGVFGVPAILFFVYVLFLAIMGPFLYAHEVTGSEGWALVGLLGGLLLATSLALLGWFGFRLLRSTLRKVEENRRSTQER